MEDLAGRINEIRVSAARFYAVDLHLHSPGSHDWDNSGTAEEPRDPDLDKVPPEDPIPEAAVMAFREAVAASRRDLVAVTDHNRSCFAEAVAAKNEESAPRVLPGIELSVAFSSAPLIRDLRIHVLAVFPEEAHHEAIARILPPGTPPESTRDPRESLSYATVDDLIGCIHREGGIAIAAHVEATNGLRGLYKNTAELLLEPIGGTPEAQAVLRTLGDHVKDELVKFDAIQVTPATDSIHYAGPNGDLRVPLVVASDCHRGQELPEDQSARYSFIKMGKPSFAAMYDALKFPDARIRLKTGLPQSQPPRLLGLRLLGHKATERTFFDDTTLGFSDNLTCVIGPRGSGKSAAIDGLRYLMGYNRSLDQIRKVSEQVLDRQKHTLANTRIEALYQASDGQIYRFVATYDPQEDYVTEVYDLDGNKLSIEDVEACGEFPLNLFGWGELELLAQNPDTQRELLDRFIPDVCELKKAKSEVSSELAQNRRECVEQVRRLEPFFTDTDLDFRRLEEYRTQFEELNTDELKETFVELDALATKRKVLKSVKRALDRRVQGGDTAPPLELGTLLEDESIKDWAQSLSARLQPDALDDWMRQTSREHRSKIEVALGVVEAEDGKLSRQEEAAQKDIQAVIGEFPFRPELSALEGRGRLS